MYRRDAGEERRGDASNIRGYVDAVAERLLDNIDDVGARSWGGINRAAAEANELNGRGTEDRDSRGAHTVVEWKGVQSISRKSVCTARSPNAATLSSYSFDRDPLGLCTQSLMALFKDRYRSMMTTD